MPYAKSDTSRLPRTWVFDSVQQTTIGPITQTGTVANTAVQAAFPLNVGVKVVKVAVSWTAIAGAPAFNLVYNTVQALGSAQAYTAGNVAPMDNAYTAGVTATTPGASLVAATTNGALTTNGTPGFPNPALTTLAAGFNQQGGLGIPTNVAVDAQPLFFADVVFNTTNFPGSATSGGQGILIPTNWDAVYPAGIYPYGNQQLVPSYFGGGAAVTPNFGASITLRLVTSTGTNSVTNLSVTLFWVPIMLTETSTSSATIISPLSGVQF